MRRARPSLARGLLVLALWLPLSGPALARPLSDLDSAQKEAFLVRLQAANATFDAGRFDEALGLYAALADDVTLAELHYRRGACLERLSRPAEAATAYRRYLELKPEASDAGRVQFDIARLEAEARRVAEVIQPPLAPPAPVSVAASVVSAPEPAPADHRLPWALAGVGAALGVGAGVFGWLTVDAIDEANGYDRRAPGHSRARLDDLQATAEDYETTFWILGGATVAAGLASGLLFALSPEVAEPDGPPPTEGTGRGLTISPGALRVRF